MTREPIGPNVRLTPFEARQTAELTSRWIEEAAIEADTPEENQILQEISDVYGQVVEEYDQMMEN